MSLHLRWKDLHSTLVLLKGNEWTSYEQSFAHLHSTLVLLKEYPYNQNKLQIILFTFYSSSIKGDVKLRIKKVKVIFTFYSSSIKGKSFCKSIK